MLTKEEAGKKIAEKLKQIQELMSQCEKLATEASVDFSFTTPYGRVEEYDGTEYYGPHPIGWNHSQC